MPSRTFRRDLGSFRCRGCGDRFYASQEAIDGCRAEVADHFDAGTDAEIASTFDFCLDCAEGEADAHEKAITPGVPADACDFRAEADAEWRASNTAPKINPRLAPAPLPAFRVVRDNGTSYVTNMAAGVTLEQARAFYVGIRQYSPDEVSFATVVDVLPADAAPGRA